MCGEKLLFQMMLLVLRGSPPRVRGKVFRCVDGLHSVGITPACAGKRHSWGSQQSLYRDHPRVCGEKMVSMIPHRRSRGSPPRMRGKAHYQCRRTDCQRITPAYAGKSSELMQKFGMSGDHPRVCGEKLKTPCWIAPNVGSPPRMRGKGE